ncbi:MAG: SurA N-terminal domain-containing protein [Prevotella sp.]|jgi:peptidyl-prolyl cis-trans isomerase D|nr:SurA N-terminal domain-containing protein [Prevotella sp.]
MAVLGKIRSHGVTLIIIIGIGLFAFIAEEAFRSCESSRNNQRQQVGEVLGESINYEEFAKLVDEASDAMKLMGQDNLNDDQLSQLRDQVWQNYVQYKLIENECDKLGLTVTDGEMQNVLNEGTNQMLLSTPFVNRQTGRFDANQLKQFLAQYNQAKTANPQMAEQYETIYKYWNYVEKSLRQQLLIQKYNGLLAHCFLSNPVEAKMSFKEENEESQIQLASYPYSSIADSKIKISESDLKSKYNDLKPRFQQVIESRDIKYIDVQISASAADRAALLKQFQGYAKDLSAAEDPTDVVRKSTSTVPYLGIPVGKEALPTDLAGLVDSMSVGQTIGPKESKQDNSLNIVKLVAKQQLPDSVQFRAIQVGGTSADDAHQRADSIYKALSAGADFATIAKKYGQEGSEQWLTTRQYEYTNTMDKDTKSYLNSLMTAAPKELKNVVLTQGNIIFEVLDRRNMVDKYTAAIIKRTIDYSKETRSSIYNKFSSFVSANQTPELIAKNAAKNGYRLEEAKDITTTQHNLVGVHSTRDAMKWLFDAKAGEVSPMYECGNNGDNLLLVICEKIHPVGYRGLDDPQVRDLVKAEVMRDKKAELLISKAKGVKSIAAAKAKGAVISNVGQVTFAAPVFVQSTGGSEPALSGAVYATKQGAFSSHPVKGQAGVYQFQVVKKSMNGAKYNEASQEMKLRQKAMQYAGNYMNELYIKAKVVDNRYLFF